MHRRCVVGRSNRRRARVVEVWRPARGQAAVTGPGPAVVDIVPGDVREPLGRFFSFSLRAVTGLDWCRRGNGIRRRVWRRHRGAARLGRGEPDTGSVPGPGTFPADRDTWTTWPATPGSGLLPPQERRQSARDRVGCRT